MRVEPRLRTLLPLCLFLLLAVSARPLSAQEPPVTETRTQPREHVVRRGDTLWDLARSYLMNPFLWPRIFDANRSVVEDPHWIYPNERLMIPGLEDTLAVPISVAERPAGIATTTEPAPAMGERSRFYRPPAEPATSREPGSVEMQTREVPYAVTPAEYAAAAWLADTASLGFVGQMTRLGDPTRREDRLPARAHPYWQLYIGRLRGAAPAPGTELMLVDIRDEVEGYGHKVVPVARVRVVEGAGDAGVVAEVVHQYAEAVAGHWAIPVPAQPQFPRGSASQVADGARGQLVAFLEEDPLKANPDQAFIDLGSDAVGIGDELTVYLPAGIAGAAEMQTARVARLKVIRAEASSSTVRVISVTNTGLANGMPVRVTGRAP